MSKAGDGRRKAWVGVVALLAAMAAIALVLVPPLLDDDDDAPDVEAAKEQPVVTNTSTSLGQRGPAFPERVVAYSGKGRIVELDTKTGEAVRTIARFNPAQEVYPQAGKLAVSPDGQTVYYDAEQSVWQVARAGGTPQRLGAGYGPVLSPDGQTLAYGTDGERGADLVLRSAVDGTERRLGRRPDKGPDVLASMAWSPDSRTLLVRLSWESSVDLVALDAHTATTIDDAAPVKYPATPTEGDDLRDHVYVDADTFLAVHECCYKEEDLGHPSMELQWAGLSLVEADGSKADGVHDVGPRRITALAVGRDPSHVIYVLDGSELLLWNRDLREPPRRLGTGFLAGVWAPA